MDNREWIVVAEGDKKSGLEIKRVFERAFLVNPIFLIDNVKDLFAYLEGSGIYGNREKFPLPGMLLLDWRFLGDGAAEHLKAIRACDGIGNMPIIVMIEPGKENELDAAYDAGATSYLRKPFTFSDFLERSRITGVHFNILGRL